MNVAAGREAPEERAKSRCCWKNWTGRVEASEQAQGAEKGATPGHIQSIRLHGTDGGGEGWRRGGGVSPRDTQSFLSG